MSARKAASYSPEVLHRLQEIELEILDVIASLCDRHGIAWFLDGGTALGAIRHKGFIPWDDDMDLGMLDADYERFVAVARDELPAGYELHVPGEGDYYAPAFAKVCKTGTRFWTQESLDAGFDQGIYIDVFPYGPVSKDERQRRRQFSGATKYTRMLYLYQSGKLIYPTAGVSGVFLRAGFRVAHFILSRCTDAVTLYGKYRQAIQCPAGFESDEVAIFSWPVGGSEPLDVVASTVNVDFEGRRYPVPHDYLSHLEWLYGKDWRELPPEDKRKSHMPLVLDFGDGRNAVEPGSAR